MRPLLRNYTHYPVSGRKDPNRVK